MMGILTLEYERSIYRHQDTSINWEQYRELWENLIKKTTGWTMCLNKYKMMTINKIALHIILVIRSRSLY